MPFAQVNVPPKGRAVYLPKNSATVKQIGAESTSICRSAGLGRAQCLESFDYSTMGHNGGTFIHELWTESSSSVCGYVNPICWSTHKLVTTIYPLPSGQNAWIRSSQKVNIYNETRESNNINFGSYSLLTKDKFGSKLLKCPMQWERALISLHIFMAL